MSNDDHDINARRKPTRGPAQHNEVEKKRRAYLSSCYVDLKMLVPSIANVKASNVTILQTAAGHVQVNFPRSFLVLFTSPPFLLFLLALPGATRHPTLR